MGMAKILQFEDIEAWQVARALVNQVYDLSDRGAFSRDFGLRDQMRRAAVSVVSNIAEGFERDGNKEFAQFLSQAKGSAGEVRAQSYVALDRTYISRSQFDELQGRALQVSRMLSGLMNYLRNCERQGRKFQNKTPSPLGPSNPRPHPAT
jgi:four helix bundle protein